MAPQLPSDKISESVICPDDKKQQHHPFTSIPGYPSQRNKETGQTSYVKNSKERERRSIQGFLDVTSKKERDHKHGNGHGIKRKSRKPLFFQIRTKKEKGRQRIAGYGIRSSAMVFRQRKIFIECNKHC